jgi:hypothetical protein
MAKLPVEVLHAIILESDYGKRPLSALVHELKVQEATMNSKVVNSWSAGCEVKRLKWCKSVTHEMAHHRRLHSQAVSALELESPRVRLRVGLGVLRVSESGCAPRRPAMPFLEGLRVTLVTVAKE